MWRIVVAMALHYAALCTSVGLVGGTTQRSEKRLLPQPGQHRVSSSHSTGLTAGGQTFAQWCRRAANPPARST